MEQAAFIRLDERDNVVTATQSLEVGAAIDGVTSRALIPRGHKIAIADIAKGAPVFKYAQVIGYAAEEIAAGDHVHIHNLAFRGVDQAYEFGTDLRPVAPATKQDTFMGYRRADGRVGTRKRLPS